MRAEALALLALAALSAPPNAQRDAVVVASKNFTESRLLGELVVAVLEEHTELEVRHRANLGGTTVCFDALNAGEVDIYCEYTGTAWAILLKEGEANTDPLEVFLRCQARLGNEYELELLPPFGFQNTYALAMREARAQELGVRTIGDLRAIAGELGAAFSAEFTNREDGYPGLAHHYGFELGDVRTLEHGLAYQAIASGQTDLIDAYSTDAKLLEYELRVLVDERGFFPPYHAAPLVRRDLLAAHPEAEAALRRLTYVLDEERMTALNHAVEVGGRDFGVVAREFLAEVGQIAARAEDEHDPQAGYLRFLWQRRYETLRLAWQHVLLSLAAVLLAAMVAIPLGLCCTRSAWLERLSLGAAGVLQTIPSLALLALLIPLPFLGLSARSAVVALFLYSLLPILRNTHTGLTEVDPELVDAARGMGLRPHQILLRVQLPMAIRTILAGVRTATVISIGVATLAAFIGSGGLGEPIVVGLYLNDTRLIVSGALPAALLALLADHSLGRLERVLTPRGLRITA